jgi:anti-sigma regulatory factor (Ser/Thr protein kinase)
LDYILADIPEGLEAELRLGLQEALVNAAKHGNKLDPRKTIFVQFTITVHECWWVIKDQGKGFTPPTQKCSIPLGHFWVDQQRECGRGLYILQQIFDRVDWNRDGNELRLHKSLRSTSGQSKVLSSSTPL